LGRDRCQIEVSHAGAEVAVAPANLLAVSTNIRPAAFELKIDDTVAVCFNRQNSMRESHAAMDGGDKPLPVGGPVKRVEMMEILVRVHTRLARLQIVHEDPPGREIRVSEALELASKVGDLGSIRAPARLVRVDGNLGAAHAVDIHVVDVADLGFAFA